jgi:hypothetical protein
LSSDRDLRRVSSERGDGRLDERKRVDDVLDGKVGASRNKVRGREESKDTWNGWRGERRVRRWTEDGKDASRGSPETVLKHDDDDLVFLGEGWSIESGSRGGSSDERASVDPAERKTAAHQDARLCSDRTKSHSHHDGKILRFSRGIDDLVETVLGVRGSRRVPVVLGAGSGHGGSVEAGWEKKRPKAHQRGELIDQEKGLRAHVEVQADTTVDCSHRWATVPYRTEKRVPPPVTAAAPETLPREVLTIAAPRRWREVWAFAVERRRREERKTETREEGVGKKSMAARMRKGSRKKGL